MRNEKIYGMQKDNFKISIYHIYRLMTREQKPDTAEFSITINNNIVISAVKFESKIMHLILMLRIFNSKV